MRHFGLLYGKLPSAFLLHSRIPQGSIIGPILFLILISNIAEDLEADVLIYVDDTKTLKTIHDVQDVMKLHHWGQANKMK